MTKLEEKLSFPWKTLRSMLAYMRRNKIMGSIQASLSCPLARALSRKLGRKISVPGFQWRVYGQMRFQRMPLWARNFVTAVDRGTGYQEFVRK